MRSSVNVKMWQSVAGAIDLNKVRSIAQAHCAWSVKVRAMQSVKRESADNATNGASAFVRNKYVIDRTNKD
jgi:hypothetical protein